MSDDLTGDRPRPGEHSDVEDSGPGSDDPRGDESSAAEDARETGVDGDVHGDGVLDREPDLDSETELSSPVTPTEETAPDDRPRRSNHRRAAALIGVLLALLGFGIAVQVRANSSGDSLSSASNDDLIRILDDQNSRADRLRQQIAALQATEQQLEASGNRDSVALAQAQQQEQALSILLGTVPTTGPGVRIVITDPRHQLKAEDLLDVIEELRGAGSGGDPVRIGSSEHVHRVPRRRRGRHCRWNTTECPVHRPCYRRPADSRHGPADSGRCSRERAGGRGRRGDHRAAIPDDHGGPSDYQPDLREDNRTVGSSRENAVTLPEVSPDV
jgi:hypothetical protein